MKFAINTVLIVFLLLACNTADESKGLRDVISLKTDSLNILKTKIDSILSKNDSLITELNYWFSEQDVAELKRKNIIDPANDIPDKLRNSPELIPFPGVLGGTMRFDKITLLKDRWVIADFDDGHIMGAALFKYSVQKNGSLKWTIIDKYIDE